MKQPVSVGRSIAKGAAWMVAMRFSIRAMGFVSTLILARILAPAEYGLVALATLIVAATETLSEFNVDIYIIRVQNPSRAQYDTAWTISVLRGIVLGLCLALFAAPAAAFFDDVRLEAVVYVFAALCALDGFQNIGFIEFRKQMRFSKDFAFLFWPKAISYIGTVGAAFILRNYWALVVGSIIERPLRIAITYAMHRYRPTFALTHWREILGFSKWLLANNVIAMVYARADTFLLGRLLGTYSVGIYSVAYDLATLSTSEILAPIQRASYAGYATVANAPASLKKLFLDTWCLTVALVVPVAAGVGLIADPFVRIALGDKWLEAVPLIQILAIYGLIQSGNSGIPTLLFSMGLPHLTTYLLLGTVALALPALYAGISLDGSTGAACAIVGANALLLTVNLIVVTRKLGLSLGDLAQPLWRSALGAVSMVAILTFAIDGLFASPYIRFPLLVMSGAIVHTGVVYVLWRLCRAPDGPERVIVTFLSSLVSRFGRSRASSASH